MPTLKYQDWGAGVRATYMMWCYRRTNFAEPHDHNFYELFWVESGTGRYGINGREESLQAGDLVLVRPEDRHSFAATRTGDFLEFVNVALAPSIWHGMRSRYLDGRALYFDSLPVETRRWKLGVDPIRSLAVLAGGLRGGARDQMTVEAFLLGVMSLLQNMPQGDAPHQPPRWLALAVEQIRLFPNFTGGPAALARLAGRSPEHVARECRRFYHKKPNELVNEARLHHAARELAGGQKEILEVALECGIENLGHFYQLFKKRFGTTPADYRSRQRGKVCFL